MKVVDMYGKEIKEGQTVNVFCTYDNGTFNMDMKCKVIRGVMGDLQLKFEDLMWQLGTHNQYPTVSTFNISNKTLDYRYTEDGNAQVVIPDSSVYSRSGYEKWKHYDFSKYIVIIEG